MVWPHQISKNLGFWYKQCCLQSVPMNVLGNYALTSMTLEYRRECRQSNLLESLTSSTAASLTEDSNNYINRRPDLEYTHLLRMLADKAEIVRARTEWHAKQRHVWRSCAPTFLFMFIGLICVLFFSFSFSLPFFLHFLLSIFFPLVWLILLVHTQRFPPLGMHISDHRLQALVF